MASLIAQILNPDPKGRWKEFYSVPSSSDPNKTYVVAKDKGGAWGCSCPRWIYHREQCKHIKKVQALSEKQEITVAMLTTKLNEATRKALDKLGRIEIDPDSERAKYLEV